MPSYIDFSQAYFLQSASRLQECPDDSLAEVAFAGRSNAGKSSVINTLTRKTGLARTSKTPGRTQLLNFFALNIAGIRLVDLPGYGYAKVPKAMQRAWQANLNDYLENRKPLCGLVLVMDSRHPLMPFDNMIIDWCIASQIPLHILLNKADKLNNNAQSSTLMKVTKLLPPHPQGLISIQLFSATKKTGLSTLEKHLVTAFKNPNQA